LLIEGTVDGLQAITDTVQDSRIPGDVPLIQKPALVIAGEIDTIVPMEDSQRLARELGAEFFVAEGAGHWPGEKDPDAVAAKLLEFLAANP